MSTAIGQQDQADRASRKIFLHIIWLPLLIGIISIIDRADLGFAALRMNRDLGFSGAVYGLGAGVLFIGYFLFEIPSNIALRKVGARVWLARIAITWGIISAATALVNGEHEFYILRFLLGAAEAGLFPGIILYLTFWFPLKTRARATALFMTAIPLASIIASPISGWLLSYEHILGIASWRMMFVIWGAPAVVLGILFLFLLPNSPEEVSWLSSDEKAWLEGALKEEVDQNVVSGRNTWRNALKDPNVWVFSLIYLCYAIGQWGMIFFLPTILKEMHLSFTTVGFVAALPWLAGLITMNVIARHSDKTGERVWHLAIPFILSGVFLIISGLTAHEPVVAIIFLILSCAGLLPTLGTFWARPTALLTASAATVGIAMINSIGNLGGFIGPYIMGTLSDLVHGSEVLGLFFMGCVAIIGGILWIFAIKDGDVRDVNKLKRP